MSNKKKNDEIFGKLLNGAGRICRLGFCEKAMIIFPCFGIGITFNDDGAWQGFSIEYEISYDVKGSKNKEDPINNEQ